MGKQRPARLLAASLILLVIAVAAGLALLARPPTELPTATRTPGDTTSTGHSGGASPTTTMPATSAEPGRSIRVGAIPGVVDITAPPYVELVRLYQRIPLIVVANRSLDPGSIVVYVNDSMGNILPCRILQSSYAGEKNGLNVYSVVVRVTQGFVRPGWVNLIVYYDDIGQPVNLTILGPYRPSNLSYTVSYNGRVVLLSVSNPSESEYTLLEASVPNCGSRSETANVTIEPGGHLSILVQIPQDCSQPKVLTVLVIARDSLGNLYADILPAQLGG